MSFKHLVLATMGKSGWQTARDIAKKAGITNEESIRALLELESNKYVKQRNALWKLRQEEM
ncbi:hypothetical protein [Klebsiella michiganensis]|uniref:hypothetical protein n=1 Tax=Klebsiella michiganensis TaxID=1134687 RepID=UPI000D651FF6|nr:hypothetical protein [Klebsiella michiganensis]